MPPPTDEQLQLIKDFEPVLFFHGGDATVPAERFFPSDAKRYLEHCALWKASTPFLTLGDWENMPVVEANTLRALSNEGGVFLGKGLPSGPFDFLETPPDKECFLDLAGWEAPGSPFPSANRYANLDRIADLYNTDTDLNGSRFWYHAEFFDADRLRPLFNSALETGDTIIHFIDLFSGSNPFLIAPELICYYLFYPGHDEGLSGCPFVDQAKEFGSFAGDWTCVSILLDRPSPSADRAPKWIGLSNRNTGIIKVGDKEVRTGMRVLLWSAAEVFQETHPRLAVARGSHALYLTTEQPSVVGPLTSNDPTTGSCGLSEAPAGEIPPLPDDDTTVGDVFGVIGGVFVVIAKMVAGAGIGSILGPLGAAVGGISGLIAGALEESSGLDVVGVAPAGPSSPTVDTVNTSSGKVVHPKGMRPPDVDQSRSNDWQSEDNHIIDGRRYDSTVDREVQILWPGDPMYKGYTGRWGPRMESDPQTRRAGMRFPNFWLLFFDALVRNAHPSFVEFLTVGSGTWTVPTDWNNMNNSIECLGAGAGGTGARTDNNVGGSGGGGGAYAKSVNLNLTPGASVSYTVGAGSVAGTAAVGDTSNAAAGGDTWFNSASFPATGDACGARGASAHVGKAAGTAGQAASSYSTGPGAVTRSGGDGGSGGGAGVAAGGGGGGAAGPNGDGGSGAAASDATPGNGGTGDSGTTPSGANGTEWDAAHGSGGGGNGGAQAVGGNGGMFGAGGGGGGYVSAGVGRDGGKGADGLIVITYTP